MAMAVPMPSFAIPRAAGVPCGAGARRSPLPEMAFGRVLKDVAAQFVGPALVAKGAGAGCGLPGRVPSRVGLPPAAAFDVVPAFAAKSAEELLSDDGFLEEIGAGLSSRGCTVVSLRWGETNGNTFGNTLFLVELAAPSISRQSGVS